MWSDDGSGHRRERRVVVAVGPGGSSRAVDWAAAEASVRGCALHVVHALRPGWLADPSGLVPLADLTSCQVVGEEVLSAARSRARSVDPDLPVDGEVTVGSTVPALVAHGQGAQVLVLGRGTVSTPRRWGGVLARSVVARIAARAPCPVAIVRSSGRPDIGSGPPRVVLGVDGAGSCAAAVGLAFRAAAQRGLPLVAVHAWTPDVPADLEAVCGEPTAAEERAGVVVDRALSPWRSLYPDVPVEVRLVVADPAQVLSREAEGAALLVVGSRGRRWTRVRGLGSVSHGVIERARCPVVVGPAVARRDVPPEPGRRDARRDGGDVGAVHRWRAPWE